jgi:hypothetical protein
MFMCFNTCRVNKSAQLASHKHTSFMDLIAAIVIYLGMLVCSPEGTVQSAPDPVQMQILQEQGYQIYTAPDGTVTARKTVWDHEQI